MWCGVDDLNLHTLDQWYSIIIPKSDIRKVKIFNFPADINQTYDTIQDDNDCHIERSV